MTPYHERLTVRLREAAEECRHGQHTGASDQRLVLLMNAAKALEDVSGNLAQARAERDAAEAKIAGANMVARQMMDRLDGTQAALTEARRVLWEVEAENATLREQLAAAQEALRDALPCLSHPQQWRVADRVRAVLNGYADEAQR